ncbi:MAG: NADH-quinone oxidoreductase subunit J family protein [Candidatus Acidiferrales bacterium]
MLLNSIFFYLFAAIAVASAILTVTRRSASHSVIFLVVALVATSGIFLQLQADFLFAVQLLVSAAGVVVLFFFAAALTNQKSSRTALRFSRYKTIAIVFAMVLAGEVLVAIWAGSKSLHMPATANLPARNTEALGDALFAHYLLPLEMVSLLLLVALIGGIASANRRTA